jgi:hypothetical protein
MMNLLRTHGNELGVPTISIRFAMYVTTRRFFVRAPGLHGGMTS